MKFIFSCCYFCLLALYIVSVDFDVDVLRCWLYIFCCTRSVLIIPAYSKHQHRALFHVIKQTRCTNFSNLFWNATLHVSDSSSVQHQEFFTVHTAMVCHTGLLTACKKDRDGTSWSCWSANLYDIPLLCEQWKTPDDGQRNCLKHVEFHSKNKSEELVHLFGLLYRNLSRCTVTWMSNLPEHVSNLLLLKKSFDLWQWPNHTSCILI